MKRANHERQVWEAEREWKYEREYEQRVQKMFAIAVPKLSREIGKRKGRITDGRTDSVICESVQRATG